MKFVKKLTALFLAVCMVMAMGITAFADEVATYTITGPSDGHTYEVYQIFTGDLNGTTLSNVKWGENGTGTKGEAVDDNTLTTIAALTSNVQATADKVATYVNFDSTAVATLTDSNSTASVVPGYYLIKDTGATTGETEAYSTYVVSVVKDLTISPKKDTPEFEKKVKDINDTTDAGHGEWQDSADHDINDVIPFKLEGTVADNYASYTTYKFIFHDVEETGLTFQNVTSVYYMNGNDKTIIDSSNYQVVTSGLEDGCTFEVRFSNLKNIEGVAAGSKIVVEYSSKLNENAVLGSAGNVNKARLEYSNNPNSEQEGEGDDTGKTPWDNVIVFTYKVVVNKIDSEEKALAGAAFKLEKEIKGVDGAANTWKEVGSFTAGDATSFTFKGLDDGNYRLTETTTPAGYNTISPITFTVTATHDIEWTSKDRNAVLTNLSGNTASGEITFTPNTSEGSLTTNVVNKKGSELPSTGGMGTTVIYIAGIAMIVAAGVVVIARKRMA